MPGHRTGCDTVLVAVLPCERGFQHRGAVPRRCVMRGTTHARMQHDHERHHAAEVDLTQGRVKRMAVVSGELVAAEPTVAVAVESLKQRLEVGGRRSGGGHVQRNHGGRERSQRGGWG